MEYSRIHKIEDLRIWQCARTLCKEIYVFTRREDFEKDFRFVQQIRAAAGSIMDNIAEGYGRSGSKEFVQFLYIAKGSCQEVISQLYRAWDVQYISEEDKVEKILENQKVLKAPIVRNGKLATVGYQPDVWKEWK